MNFDPACNYARNFISHKTMSNPGGIIINLGSYYLCLYRCKLLLFTYRHETLHYCKVDLFHLLL